MNISIPGYAINEKSIYESPATLIFSGTREADQMPVIIKIMKIEHPSPAELVQFKTEYEITKLFDSPRIGQAYALEKYQNNFAIILELIDADSLAKTLLRKKKFDIKEFLELAIQLAEAIGEIHQKNIVHNDINPSNALFDAVKNQVKVIDFGLSASLSKAWTPVVSPNMLQGTLAYLSPEQTGRMNRGVDYRTDFYSLGITFYQLLTGELPFKSQDPLELIHCHIAILPKPPHEIDPSIPEAISSIIMKLVSKEAEERYQSAHGLVCDLQKCLDQLNATGEVAPFDLGLDDLFDRFQIPEKLYGRKKEVEILLETYERVAQGKVELMLVTGYSGIGKSSLVHEVHKPIVEKRGYFIAGKFEQFKHNIPYAAFTQAFSELVNQILTESEESIADFKQRVLDAVGALGQLLIDIIPNLHLIIGKQPPVEKAGPTESQNRLSNTIQKCITALAQKEHPLTIFLDDLQWADTPSLKLIETLLTNMDCNYLFLIGAYRNNEVDATHPLSNMIEDLQKRNIECESIILGPLQKEDVEELVAETLHRDKASVSPLAEIVYTKTEGNPFFLIQLLKSLYKEQLIDFDSQKNEWIWHLDKIQSKKITENVVDLILDKVGQLSPDNQRILQIAACIGARFNTATLLDISSKSFEELSTPLKEMMQEGFILKIGDLNQLPTYQFAHDRIQQAAYSLVDESEKKTIHIKIARFLLKTTPEESLHDEIFNIVNHFNIAIEDSIPDIIDPEERKRIAEINLKASKLAKAAAAYEPALKYAEYSIKCLEKEGVWKSDYDMIFESYMEATDSACLSSQFDLMEKYAKIASSHVKNIFDEVKIAKIKIAHYAAKKNFKPALEIATSILGSLGVNLPLKPTKIDVLFAILKVKFFMIGKNVPDLIDLPELNDPSKQAAMSLMNFMVSIVIQSFPDLFAILTCKGVSMTLQYGTVMESATSYSSYALVCCGALDEIETGYQFGDLALALMEKKNLEESRTKIIIANYGFIKHWKDPIKESILKLRENFETGINKGDIEYACYSLSTSYFYSFMGGLPLKELSDKLELHRAQIYNLQNMNVYEKMSICHQAMLNCIETKEQPNILDGTAFNDTELVASINAETDKLTIYILYCLKTIVSCFFEKYREAVEYSATFNLYLEASFSTFFVPAGNFYQSLSLLGAYPDSPPHEQTKMRKIIKANQKKMKKWADFCPSSDAQKYLLVEAEWASKVLNQPEKAEELYNQAIALANKHEFIHEEALANELLAKFYLGRSREKIAKIYLEEARHCYILWGAEAKVAQLDLKYPKLLDSGRQGQEFSSLRTISAAYSGKTSSAALDMSTFQKCSQLISSTIVLDDLLNKLMHIVIENAGAQQSFLLLAKNDKYVIEAMGKVGEDEAEVLQSIEPTSAIIPTTIINYVVRTKESIVLDQASRSNQFGKDPYVIENQSKSILCLPLLNQGKLTGILYLENNLLEGAFTKDRIELLNILSSQIAISIDNARLYESTVKLNESLNILNKSYERFVPQDFLSLLNKKSIVDVALGDHTEKNMSVLFTDIRNFTSRSEGMTPEENFTFINSFLQVIAPIIRKHNGFIDKYIGDAIMALYPDGADDAVRCALDMQRALTEYNKSMAEPVAIGIGINTGFLMLGTVGEKYRLGATVISDAVNVASRVESQTKVHGVKILITEETYKNLRRPETYTIEKLGGASVKGKSQEVILYKVLESVELKG